MGNIFPALPILNEIVHCSKTSLFQPLSDVAFIVIQHMLESTGSLIEALLGLGVCPENIYALGKYYSNNEKTIVALI
jgi:hypothetical protein